MKNNYLANYEERLLNATFENVLITKRKRMFPVNTSDMQFVYHPKIKFHFNFIKNKSHVKNSFQNNCEISYYTTGIIYHIFILDKCSFKLKK